MSGTKIVKLKLEGDGTGQKLPDLRQNPMEKALSAYELIEEQLDINGDFRHVSELLGDVDVKPSQLQQIITKLEEKHALEDRYPSKAGLIVNTLIRKSTSTVFKFKNTQTLNLIGFELEGDKKVTMEGNAGPLSGAHMKDGELHVKGNVGQAAGHQLEGGMIIIDGNADRDIGWDMMGGVIHVKKNAQKCAGREMKAGLLIVDGNTGEHTGSGMTGGRIEVGGTIEAIGSDAKGEIYNKGEKVWPK
ncbi:MAG: hypothetical protein V1921_06575 [Candidatus Altiarchaeota archaeon]